MLIGAALGIAFDFSLDYFLGDQCYTLAEGLFAGLLGATGGGVGFWATGVKRAGLEFSHAIPTRFLNQSRFGQWLNRRANPYRALNGNYVTASFHASTDYYRRVAGRAANDMFDPFRRYLFRTPAWIPSGLIAGGWSFGLGCGCAEGNND